MKKIYKFVKFLFVLSLTIPGLCYAQNNSNTEPRFKTIHVSQSFTRIATDTNKNVCAGTTSQGISL